MIKSVTNMKCKVFFLAVSLMFSGIIQAQNIVGSWSGKISYGANSIQIVFNFSENTKGEVVCTMDSPNQSVKGIPASVSYMSSDSISIQVPNYGIEYTGKLKEGVIRGIYSQAGFKTEIDLHYGLLEYKRPQNPKEPYPYMTEEVKFINDEIEAVLSGTITYPVGYDKRKKVPVILLITGSGPQNRDNEIYEHKSFLIIADYFARNGYATLRYDDRSVGKSTGKYQAETTKEVAKDAELALKFLRKSKQFSKIGALGHSEGANVVFMLGAKRLIDFAICMAGMGLKGDDCLYEQAVTIADNNGQKYQFTKEQFRTYLKETGIPWYNFFLDYDPAFDINKTVCPVFAMNGEKDMQVIATSNLEAIRKNLPKNKESRIKLYPGLNHLFQECNTGLPTEYLEIEQTISPLVLEDMVDWLRHLYLWKR